MSTRRITPMLIAILAILPLTMNGQGGSVRATPATPLVIGETFTLESAVLKETRRINVYMPPGCGGAQATACPVLYMPDGGVGEDFIHVAGLVQVSVGNDTMRPFVL